MTSEKTNTIILVMIFVVLLSFTYSQWNIGRYVTTRNNDVHCCPK